MAVTREEIVEALKEMPALELSELVKELEEVFGVSAAAPVMVAGAAGAPALSLWQAGGKRPASMHRVGKPRGSAARPAPQTP